MYTPRPLTMMMTLAALLSAAPSLASAQAVLVADGGALRRYSGQTQETILTCVERRGTQLVVPPYNISTSEQPCYLPSLTADPKTGRWALTVDASPDMYATHEILINGVSYKVPLDKKDQAVSSGLLVYGDTNSIQHVWTGIPMSRDSKGRVVFQHVDSFSEDGSRIWVLLLRGPLTEVWSWTLGPTHAVTPVKAPVITDVGYVPLLIPGQPVVLRDAKRGKLRAARLPADGAPKLGAATPIKGGQASWRSPIILGDEVFYYVEGPRITRRIGRFEGSPECDPARPGTYRRMHLKTGQEQIWRTHDRCEAAEPLFIRPRGPSDALYFHEMNAKLEQRIYRLDVPSGAVSEVAAAPQSRALDVSADGAQLLIAGFDGLGLWDAPRGGFVWKIAANKDTARVAFTLGESPSAAP